MTGRETVAALFGKLEETQVIKTIWKISISSLNPHLTAGFRAVASDIPCCTAARKSISSPAQEMSICCKPTQHLAQIYPRVGWECCDLGKTSHPQDRLCHHCRHPIWTTHTHAWRVGVECQISACLTGGGCGAGLWGPDGPPAPAEEPGVWYSYYSSPFSQCVKIHSTVGVCVCVSVVHAYSLNLHLLIGYLQLLLTWMLCIVSAFSFHCMCLVHLSFFF